MANVTVITRFRTRAGSEDELFKAVDPFLKKTRKEEGCVIYDVYRNVRDGTFGIFHEVWRDWQAINSHIGSSHFQQFMGAASPLLINLNERGDNPFEVNTAQLFDPSQPPTAEIVLVATRMKAAPGKAKQVAEDTRTLVLNPSNNEEGCLGYDLYQNRTDADLFLLYEQWRGFKAIQDHMATGHFNAFMKAAPVMLIPPETGTKDLFEVMICTPYLPS